MGVGFETGPAIKLPLDATASEVGSAILMLFDECGLIVEHPKTFGGSDMPVLQQAGSSSWTAFMKTQPELFMVSLTEFLISIEFWKRDGKGFCADESRQVISFPRDISPTVLGDAILGR